MSPRRAVLDVREEVEAQRTEKALELQIRGFMKQLGWEPYYHTTRSQWSPAGFPDACAVNVSQRRLIFVEFKRTAKEKLGPDQEKWRDALLAIGAEWYRWDWDTPLDEITSVLRARPV